MRNDTRPSPTLPHWKRWKAGRSLGKRLGNWHNFKWLVQTVFPWLLPVGTINFRLYLPVGTVQEQEQNKGGFDLPQPSSACVPTARAWHWLWACAHSRNAHDWFHGTLQVLGTYSAVQRVSTDRWLDKGHSSWPHCQQWAWLSQPRSLLQRCYPSRLNAVY